MKTLYGSACGNGVPWFCEYSNELLLDEIYRPSSHSLEPKMNSLPGLGEMNVRKKDAMSGGNVLSIFHDFRRLDIDANNELNNARFYESNEEI
ncbi:hypothetical protein KM043_001953 [Ampulex compressa]|nr:hypothetical protein KM043_001953 [Ampulex compressa]